jgi:voltage-gated potassium channel
MGIRGRKARHARTMAHAATALYRGRTGGRRAKGNGVTASDSTGPNADRRAGGVIASAVPYLAAAGLAAVTLLSLRGLSPGWTTALWAVLAGVWAIFAAELAVALVNVRSLPPSRHADLALLVVSVAVPVAAFLLPVVPGDRPLFFGIWVLRILSDIAGVRIVARVLRAELRNLLGVTALFLVIVFAAALLAYLAERDAQPDQFGSIPAAMWWAVTTLTTTGYGDEIPRSFAGRALAGVVMMSGIGVFALWAGILATGFAQELRRRDFSLVWKMVARTPVFASVDRGDLAGIVEALRPRRYGAGAAVCKKGQPGTEMYFITEGRVRIEAPVPVELGAGEWFGEMALVTGAPRTATVTAATAVEVLTLHVADFQRLFGRDSDLARTIRRTADERAQANAAAAHSPAPDHAPDDTPEPRPVSPPP